MNNGQRYPQVFPSDHRSRCGPSECAPRAEIVCETCGVMRTHTSECSAATFEALDFVDMTDEIQTSLDDSGIQDGHVTVFTPDSSCALVVNELESGLLSDIKAAAGRLGSGRAPNGKTMIGSTSVVIPAVDGVLRLGTWQRVLLVELEGARTRSIVVQIVGE